jgi:hypothetical protein
MNLIDATVLEVLGEPYLRYGKWFVKCKISAYGCESETDAMFSTKEQADLFKVGDIFQV